MTWLKNLFAQLASALRARKVEQWAVANVLMLLGGTIVVAVCDDALYDSVGSSLIATAISAGFLFLNFASNEERAEALRIFDRFGLRKVFPERSLSIKDEYDARLASARNIDVLGHGLRHLREDFGSKFPEWAARGGQVRILLLHPAYPTSSSSYASARDREEGNDPGALAGDVRKFIEEATQAFGSVTPDNFHIRLYRCMPTLNVFRADDWMFWGPWLARGPSRKTFTVLVTRGPVFDQVHEHFERIWSSSDLSVSLADYLAETKEPAQ